MSYDVTFMAPVCAHCSECKEKVKHWSPTYNYGPIFRAANIEPREHLVGKSPEELLQAFREAEADIRARPEVYEALEPENKWGTVRELLPCLQSLIELCEQNPGTTVTKAT